MRLCLEATWICLPPMEGTLKVPQELWYESWQYIPEAPLVMAVHPIHGSASYTWQYIPNMAIHPIHGNSSHTWQVWSRQYIPYMAIHPVHGKSGQGDTSHTWRYIAYMASLVKAIHPRSPSGHLDASHRPASVMALAAVLLFCPATFSPLLLESNSPCFNSKVALLLTYIIVYIVRYFFIMYISLCAHA